MKLQQGFCKLTVFLGLALILAGAAQMPRSAWASMEDAAIFYDELKDQGEWVDYGNYGPVWYPTQVQENWRPYVDGRWTPSDDGYVFETQEPWAPSTYHYGNWMPTQEYGWVWVPGNTWYPNTVSWRTSPDSVAPDASYVGWAPVPPPDYNPAPGYYPPNYSGGASYSGPVDNLMTSPFWIFVRAASFLLGLTSPYSPSYSYWGSNALVPVQMVPYYYTRTVIVNNYYAPSYYPAGYIAPGGYYNWGPSIPYVSRVTHIRQATINNYMRQVNIYQRRNVVPPAAVLARHPYFRDVLPPAMLEHQPLPRGARYQGAHVARANLVRPNLVNASMMKNPPRISATIPKAQMESGPWHRGVPGVALPSSAIVRPNQQMQRHISSIPASRQLEPVSPSARHWNVPQAPGPAAVQPQVAPRHRGPEATSVPGPTAPGAIPYGHGPQQTPQTVTHGTPGTPQAVVPQQRYKPQERQSGPWGKHEQTPQATVTPKQYPRQKQMHTSPPGTPPAATTAIPSQNVPQRHPRTQPQPPPQQQAPFQAQPQRQAPRQPQPIKQAPVQTQPQMHRQPPFQPQQVHRQPQPQPQQVQHQPQPQMQMHQQPRPQPQPQGQPRPQGSQQQQNNKKHNQQNQ
jgi:Family of unknown function (DUF6600)